MVETVGSNRRAEALIILTASTLPMKIPEQLLGPLTGQFSERQMAGNLGFLSPVAQPMVCWEFTSPMKITEQLLGPLTGQFSERQMAGNLGFLSPVAQPMVCWEFTSPMQITEPLL